MKKLILFLFFAMAAGCAVGHHSPNWYADLHTVDSDRISDSLMRAIALDSTTVKEILISAGWVLDSSADTLHPDTAPAKADEGPPPTTLRFGGWYTTHSAMHSAIMQFYDSMEAANTLRTDSVVLNLDSLTLLARSGDTEAQRQLDIRHAIEGDINGMWTSEALMVRDDSMRTQIIDIGARFACSDSAKAMLERLGK